MKVLKKTVSKQYVTGVEFTGKEFLSLLIEHDIELSIGDRLPILNKNYETGPGYDDWTIEGKVVINFIPDLNSGELPEVVK